MRIQADRAVCISAGNCVEVAPELFAQEPDNGVVIALTEEVGEDQRPTAEEAADVCPVAAILLTAR